MYTADERRYRAALRHPGPCFFISLPSRVSLVSPPAFYLSSLPFLFLPPSLLTCYMHFPCMFTVDFPFLLVCSPACVSVLCFCCFPFMFVFSWVPFPSFMSGPLTCMSALRVVHREWHDYLLLVEHQLHFVLLAHPDWNRSQCSFGVTSRAALRGAARRP